MRPAPKLALFLSVLLISPPSLAETVSVTGGSGSQGIPGAPGAPGTPGADGSDAAASASTDPNNFATARGGAGGDGGRGGFGGGVGASGGDGGDARAEADSVGTTTPRLASASAVGGAGGDGGLASGGTPVGPGGDGGDGGDAVARAEARNTGSTSVSATAGAIGGNGGETQGPFAPGVAGTATATAHAESDTGRVSSRATVVGGAGSGEADGADADIESAATGSTRGQLTIFQRSTGGRGGDDGGAGGSATSGWVGEDPAGGALDLSVRATGGLGGSRSGRGGNAELGRIEAHTTGASDLDIEGLAHAGRAGFAAGPVAAGGDATAGAILGSSGSGVLRIGVEVVGGIGTERGGNALAVESMDGETSGDLFLTKNARAGGTTGVAGADGGRAEIELDNDSGNSALVSGRATAHGGSGGHGRDDGTGPRTGGLGGDARITSHLRNEAGSIESNAYAVAGAGGSGDGAGGRGGNASVQADASSASDILSIRVGGFGPFGALAGDGGDLDRSASPSETQAGRGGDADSGASAVASGATDVTVFDRATGGEGGNLLGGAGRGGRGGDASSSVFATNGGNESNRVRVSARADGGEGGQGQHPDADGGDGGEATAAARGLSSPSGGAPDSGASDVEVSVQEVGGRGGGGRIGGAGADSSLVDAASGATRGHLQLSQRAFGGDGGTGTTEGGEAGDAHAGLVASNGAGGSLLVDVAATGGRGGAGPDGGGQDGGAATLGEVRGFSDVGSDVSVTASAGGGRGGAGGGNGRSVALENTVDGETAGVLVLRQTAGGGSAGGGSPVARGGDGASTLEVEKSSAQLDVESRGFGGNGVGEASPGGQGDAIARARNQTGDSRARAWGRGGAGGQPGAGLGSRGGDGTAVAESTSVVGGAFAEAIATGGLGWRDGAVGGAADASASARAVGEAEVFATADAGQGATGADGTARASGHGLADAAVLVSASASGGDAVEVNGLGETGGVGGGTAAWAEGHSDAGGRVEVSSTEIGGTGGSARGGAIAGAGSSIVQTDRVGGSTAGKLRLVQYAEGGAGGIGRDAASASGDGGDAWTSLSTANDGGGDLQLLAIAQGGSGNGSSSSPVAAGGDARVDAAVGRSTHGANVEVGAMATGGGSRFQGGVASLGRVFGESNGGDVHVSGIVRGGGAGLFFQPLGSGSLAVQGEDVALANAVDGHTVGVLRLDQIAVGGGGFGGERGGQATSDLTRVEATEGLVLFSGARAGGGSAALGADAVASASGRNEAGHAEVLSAANGGTGLERGGDAHARSYARTDRDGDRVKVGRERSDIFTVPSIPPGAIIENFAFDTDLTSSGALGGVGAAVASADADARAGDGGDAWSEGEGDARGDAEVDVFDRAIGGDAGALRTSSFPSPFPLPNEQIVAEGGRGGDARSLAQARGRGESFVYASANAVGGNGSGIASSRFGFFRPLGRDGITRGLGGDAVATALAVGEGEVEAEAFALAGRSSAGEASGLATAISTAKGRSGRAIASALSDVASFELLAKATAAVGSPATASARSAIGRDLGGPRPEAIEAWSDALGLPQDSLVESLIAGTPGVAAGLEATAQGQPSVLAFLDLGGATNPDHDGLSITMRSEASLTLDRETFGGHSLAVGFLGATGREQVESISVEITGDDAPLASWTFADLDAAVAAMTDVYLVLGEVGSGEEDFSFSVALEMTFVGIKAGFGTQLLVTAVPEPGAALLVGVGFLVLTRRRRSR